ncbi:DUF1097 domain-containing protein [Actinomycetospora endophytica]|uniref:DUF1097 domain-containing protein n=1 Tax=Actinomycetospora endophytica TaxID=2291215 RepID=A0ABS8PDE2_9PSEU|nr:DUF1097 domain-containing protein [Actinomycetospora endophytica]MCD2196292.1 DUF1097 domain-containing protein [Actinomycetospora endophytica]
MFAVRVQPPWNGNVAGEPKQLHRPRPIGGKCQGGVIRKTLNDDTAELLWGIRTPSTLLSDPSLFRHPAHAWQTSEGTVPVKLPVALAIVIGVVGGVLTWLYVGPLAALGLFVPATFMGAALYFAAGGDLPALKKSVPATVWGVVMGTVTLIVVGTVSGAAMTGVVVGAGTLVLILGALVPLLEFVPGAVVAFAMTVGWGLLSSASGTDFAFKTGPFTVMLISFVIGGLYGWVGSILVGKLIGATTRTPAAAPAKAVA